MSLQDLLRDVVVLDAAKPPVQLGDEDHVDLILFYVSQKAQETLTVFHRLAGGDSLICIAINDREAVTLRILGEGTLLGREGETVEVLLLSAFGRGYK